MRVILSFLSAVILFGNISATQAAEIDFSQYKGKVVYLDFWASWCGPCRNSFPWMTAMQHQYAPQGLQVIAVNLDQEPELAKKFLAEFNVNFPIEYDAQGTLAEQFSVETMPTSFLLDRDGKARFKHKGFHDDKMRSYENEIRQLLKE
jgi:cytochrome c biogenesis protein CcmG, thiol:disulfide interchange protein DsbE